MNHFRGWNPSKLVDFPRTSHCPVNRELGQDLTIYGIVTNGEGWKFYRLDRDGAVSESLLCGIREMPVLLGLLREFFRLCEQNLERG